MNNGSYYKVGGSLKIDDSNYVERRADSQLYQALKLGEFCYVLDSRQVGKSSILVRIKHRLQQEGFSCTYLDMTRIGSENINPIQWYKGIISELWQGFNLVGKVNLKAWWREGEDVSVLQSLSRFIEDVLLVQVPGEKIFIFVDEIDSILSLNFSVDDFFALIRFCYNQRAHNPEYNRLTFALFGVATPSDLIRDKTRTPFNIGTAIDLPGFQLEEAQPLTKGLEGRVSNPQGIFREILAWTSGQPFLTQKLCQLVVMASSTTTNGMLNIPPGTEAFWVENLVRDRIIKSWEGSDEPEHLRTIRDRILRNEQRAGRLLGIYQQILQSALGGVPTDDSREQIELLLSGLVVKQQGFLRVKNPIYQEVFNLEWVEKQLKTLRPYSQAFEAWVAAKGQDSSRLLRGQALRDAQLWSVGKSLSDGDYQFLAASQEMDRQEVQQVLEAERTKEVERRLVQEKKSARRQRLLLALVTLALLIAIGLGLTAFLGYRQAALSEIKAIAISSDTLFNLHKNLDALIEAIRAKQHLEQLGRADPTVELIVDKVLRQAVYDVVESNRLSGHNGPVYQATFSPDGKTIATASRDKTVKLWQRDGTLVRTLTGHGDRVWGVAFSPDGEMIATASWDKTVKLWQKDGTLILTLTGHQDRVWGVAFSPDGKTIATASWDRTIKLWQRDGTLLRTLAGHSDRVWEAVFSPDGKAIASASEDKTVKLWQIDGTLLGTFAGHGGSVYGVGFSPDGSIIASASEDRTVRLWQPDGTLLNTLYGYTDSVYGVAFSPDGSVLASTSGDTTVKLWSRQGILLKNLQGHSDRVWRAAFSPDGKTLATASRDRTVRLWQYEGTLLKNLQGHKDWVWDVKFSPDGQTFVSAGRDKMVKLWHKEGTLLHTLTGHSDEVLGVAFSPDGKAIASASRDRTVKLWTINGMLLRTFSGHNAAVWSVAFSPDGQTIASASEDRTVKLWQTDGTLVRTLRGHRGSVYEVTFASTTLAFKSSDSQALASASEDQTVKLWKTDGTLLRTLSGHNAAVWSVAFSPDSETIASASEDKTVKLWKTNGTLLHTLTGHAAAVYGVAYSSRTPVTHNLKGNTSNPAGRQDRSFILASAADDRTVKLWRHDGTLVTTLNGHTDSVFGVGFSPDGKTLASASDDKTVILWNLRRVMEVDNLITYGCNWVRDYLRTNAEVEKSDRDLCR
ncbi:MAG TPA: hypothetical protein DDZ80_28510 [Cyanobacteria bacterium UBA8803]|nr:hypothetical protein [Cyanobacteria bacterium UBA9273]HBL62199.1 hypothetical protein [Cyanobacteria bacterium UBA8803]